MGQPSSADLAARCAAIELLAVDVDGVLTDGVIAVDDRGLESKHFHVRDGLAYALWQRAGKQSAIFSGRRAEVVDRRAAELKIAHVAQGLAEKAEPLLSLLARLGLEPRRFASWATTWSTCPRCEWLAWQPVPRMPSSRSVIRFTWSLRPRAAGRGSRGRRGHSQSAGALAWPLRNVLSASSVTRSDAGVFLGTGWLATLRKRTLAQKTLQAGDHVHPPGGVLPGLCGGFHDGRGAPYRRSQGR